jgi:hypothetical protein
MSFSIFPSPVQAQRSLVSIVAISTVQPGRAERGPGAEVASVSLLMRPILLPEGS